MTSAAWRVREIDRETWLPFREVACVESARVKRAMGKDAPLMESGEMTVTGEVTEGYYRIEMLRASGRLSNIATLLFTPDGSEFDHGVWGGTVTGKSVLTPAEDKKFGPGEYAPNGVDGALYCAGLLRGLIDAPVEVRGSFFLSEHVVFELGEEVISGIWKVLDAGGFCMQIQGDGTVVIKEIPKYATIILNASNRCKLMPKMSRSLPIEDVPNSITVYEDGQEVTYSNDDPASPISTVSRKRVIEVAEENPTRKEGETLFQYAKRRLEELSDVYETIDIEHEEIDGAYPYEPVSANLPRESLEGEFRFMSQDVECERGCRFSSTIGRRA